MHLRFRDTRRSHVAPRSHIVSCCEVFANELPIPFVSLDNSAMVDRLFDGVRREFPEIIRGADYQLAPRGSANYAYRPREAMCVGRRPLFVATDCAWPFNDEVDWWKLLAQASGAGGRERSRASAGGAARRALGARRHPFPWASARLSHHLGALSRISSSCPLAVRFPRRAGGSLSPLRTGSTPVPEYRCRSRRPVAPQLRLL